jgi:putative hydrolases of HD superfamily
MGRRKQVTTTTATTNLILFFQSVLQLKSIKRAGWTSKAKISDPESVSDHTYAMCAISMILSDVFGLDTERVMKMVILHDLAESIIGDYMPGEITKEKKQLEERKAMNFILSQIPVITRSNYKKIWQEYKVNRTDVAKFVHKVDKLEMALQAIQYIKEGYSDRSLIQFFDSARRSLSNYEHDNKVYDTDPIVEILNTLKQSLTK